MTVFYAENFNKSGPFETRFSYFEYLPRRKEFCFQKVLTWTSLFPVCLMTRLELPTKKENENEKEREKKKNYKARMCDSVSYPYVMCCEDTNLKFAIEQNPLSFLSLLLWWLLFLLLFAIFLISCLLYSLSQMVLSFKTTNKNKNVHKY